MSLGRDKFLQLYQSGVSETAKLARAVGVSGRTIQRWKSEHALPLGEVPGPPMPPQVRERAEALLKDGVPGTWVAEDLGLSAASITRIRKASDIRPTLDFNRAFCKIRCRPELLALHREFAPS